MGEQHALIPRLVHCNVSDRSIAEPIAKHLDVLDEVISGDGSLNLEGRHKAKALVEKLSETGSKRANIYHCIFRILNKLFI